MHGKKKCFSWKTMREKRKKQEMETQLNLLNFLNKNRCNDKIISFFFHKPSPTLFYNYAFSKLGKNKKKNTEKSAKHGKFRTKPREPSNSTALRTSFAQWVHNFQGIFLYPFLTHKRIFCLGMTTLSGPFLVSRTGNEGWT